MRDAFLIAIQLLYTDGKATLLIHLAALTTVLVTVLAALGGTVLPVLLLARHGAGASCLLTGAGVHLMAHVASGLGGHGMTLLLLALANVSVRVHLMTVHAHGRGGGLGLACGLVGHVSDAAGGLASLVSGL